MTTTPVQRITDEQLAEIEFLAGKATQGKWWIDSHGHTMVSLDGIETIFDAKGDPKDAVRHEETGNLSFWRNDWDATYIANSCPKNIQAILTRLRAAEKDADRYRDLLVSARSLINQGSFETGVCCCGDQVDRHTFGDGHSPVDEGWYAASQALEKIDAALQEQSK